ncbi:uncharacterized protein LOC108600775 isoform X2 [Drosophila busckii]|uniref:uncharacterized protein LOC108600775 isoform X2 n=1 Tax=Drosophila busckii TaxID=30019 RepID=UPI00083F4F5D|nr:uncharacterized protein LOC108600775 isoform X2 [Drosophila busckii]
MLINTHITAVVLGEIVDNSLNPAEHDEANSKLPSEVQRAVCTVNAGEVKASAEAVTTKTLKGVCGSDEMNLAFRNLEEKMYSELREIKDLLMKLQAAPSSNSINNAQLEKFTTNKPLANKVLKLEQIALKPIQEATTKRPAMLKSIEEDTTKRAPQLKSMESALEREQEIFRFNNTMLADQDFQLFTYYWKLENVTEHIDDVETKTLKSPVFSIRGRNLQLKCTFGHLQRELIMLQLALAQPAHGHGKENNIILDMGGQYKQLKWAEHLPLKHKISLLDQHAGHRHTDLSSQELNKLDMGFSIPNSAVLGSNYVRHNSLLIQIILYL